MRPLRELRCQALHDRVYEEIRRALMAGQFEPGEKVISRKLAAAPAAADMPVRTAMSRVIAEGRLLRRPNGTVCVPLSLATARFRDDLPAHAPLRRRTKP